jgi:hypothetical protein
VTGLKIPVSAVQVRLYPPANLTKSRPVWAALCLAADIRYHVTGSVSRAIRTAACGVIPMGVLCNLGRRLGRFDADVESYVICESGHRCAADVRLLNRAGFEHAYSVKGGTSAWRGKLMR